MTLRHKIPNPQFDFLNGPGGVVLAIGAHPDDLELACGGTLACLAEAGVRVVMAVVSIPNQIEVRKAEARRAAEILGCEIRFLTPDRASSVEDLKTHELVDMIGNLVDELAPASVFTHGPAMNHLDHRLVYEASILAQEASMLGGPACYFDHFCYAPTFTRPVTVSFAPKVFVDISGKIELKTQAIDVHFSQFGQRSLCASHVRELDHQNGRSIGVNFAEGFEVERLRIDFPANTDRIKRTTSHVK